MKTTTARIASAPGGAHHSWSMFGARGPLLNEADGSNGGGSGGGDTGNATASGQAGTATAPAGATEGSFTQAQVNQIAARAREEGRRSAEKERQQQTATTTSASSSGGDEPLTMRQLKERLDESELRRGFDKRAAKFEMSDETADDLFQLYKAQKPTDATAWFGTKAQQFGFKPLGSGTTSSTNQAGTAGAAAASEAGQQNQQQQATQPRPPAAPRAPAGNNQPTQGGLVDIWNMIPDQLNQLGPAGLREEFEKHLAVHNRRAGAPPLPKVSTRKQ